MNIIILGLTVTSSWGNGHATTYRSLIRGLAARGHRILFLERDTPWYRGNRDEANPEGARTVVYDGLEELFSDYEGQVKKADLVIVGSFVPDGIAIGRWVTSMASGVTAFYDIDTPVTMAKLDDGTCEYITPELIPRYNMYLSFTGGRTLKRLERDFHSPMARALYCSVDTNKYLPVHNPQRLDLGYLGTWSEDRQPSVDELLLEPARMWSKGRFAVAGPQYPESICWPENVARKVHLSPREHPAFYGSQKFTLNVTRDAMKDAGYSPSVRLFEAGACGVPIISDYWDGLDTFFEPGREILLAATAEDTLRHLRDLSPATRLQIGDAARQRVLREHSYLQRGLQLEKYFREVGSRELTSLHSAAPAKAVAQ